MKRIPTPIHGLHGLFLLPFLALVLSGCGQKGDLYLPVEGAVDTRQQAPKAVEEEALGNATGIILQTNGALKAEPEKAPQDDESEN